MEEDMQRAMTYWGGVEALLDQCFDAVAEANARLPHVRAWLDKVGSDPMGLNETGCNEPSRDLTGPDATGRD